MCCTSVCCAVLLVMISLGTALPLGHVTAVASMHVSTQNPLGASLRSAQHSALVKCLAQPVHKLLQCILKHTYLSFHVVFYDSLQVPMMGGVPGALPGYQQAQPAPLQSMQRFHSQQLPPSRGPHHTQRQHSGMAPAGDHPSWMIGGAVRPWYVLCSSLLFVSVEC